VRQTATLHLRSLPSTLHYLRHDEVIDVEELRELLHRQVALDAAVCVVAYRGRDGGHGGETEGMGAGAGGNG
jgi:hypothetical protein